jgi:ribonuclease HI
MIYVNCDASYRGGWAGLAVHSDHLESQSRLMQCKNNSEAELRALLLAMEVAQDAKLRAVVFRTDCESAARPHVGDSAYLRPFRAEVCLYLAAHQPGWSLAHISRGENVLAHALARDARRSRDEVTVHVDSNVATALIQRAGITETSGGRWQVTPGKSSANLDAALTAALLKLAGVATPISAIAAGQR